MEIYKSEESRDGGIGVVSVAGKGIACDGLVFVWRMD